MKIKTSNKKLIVLITAVVTLGIIVGLLYYFKKNDNLRISNTGEQGAQKSESDDELAKIIQEKPENKSIRPNTDTPIPIPSGSTQEKITVPMSATLEVYNGTLSIRGGVDGAVLYDGECYALLKGPAGEIIKQSTPLLQNPSTTDCKTITMSAAQLSRGHWVATLHYESDTKRGETNEKTFDNK